MFPPITAVLSIQVGSVAHTRQLLKEWSLVKSVMVAGIITGIITMIITGMIGHAAAVTIVTI